MPTPEKVKKKKDKKKKTGANLETISLSQISNISILTPRVRKADVKKAYLQAEMGIL